MTQKHLLTSVPSAFKSRKCELIRNQNKLSTEVRINFRKLPETTTGHIETINITRTKKAVTSTCTFSRGEFSFSSVSTQLPHKSLQAKAKMMLNRYSRFSLFSPAAWRANHRKSVLSLHFKTDSNPYRFISHFYILSNLVSEFHGDVQQYKFFFQFDKRDQKLAHKPRDANWLPGSTDALTRLFSFNLLNPWSEQFFNE